MAINKVEYGGNTLIDLTGDDVTQSDVKSGVAFHLPSGTQTVGTMATTPVASVSLSDFLGLDPYVTFEKYADSLIMMDASIPSSGTASAGDVLSGCTFYNTAVNPESKRTGTMPNIGSVSETIDPGDTYTIPEGYHDGTGTVTATGGGTGTMKAVGARLQLGINDSAKNSSVLDTEVEDGTISVYFYMDQDSATGYVQGSHNNSSWTTLYSRNTDGARSVTTYSGYRYYRLRISGTKTSGNWLVGTMTCIVSGTESANAFNPEEEVI